MLPNLSSLVPWSGSPVKRPRGWPNDRLQKVLSAIRDAEEINDLNDVVDAHRVLNHLTDAEIATIGKAVVAKGHKILVAWFLQTYPQAIAEKDLPRNATGEWWYGRSVIPQFPSLNLKRDADGFVTIDLWHARRGTSGPVSFKDFNANYPTYFLGSRGTVEDSLGDLEDYIEEADEWERPEEQLMYVKRGRFRINPLLWFDDKNVTKLRKDAQKAGVVAALVNSHPSFKNTEFNLNSQSDAKWKKSLYYRTEVISGVKVANELRLDNNCVDESAIPLAAGYHGTLAVDVSGLAGAAMPPGSVDFQTKSVVVWDVPGTVVEEEPWERVYKHYNNQGPP